MIYEILYYTSCLILIGAGVLYYFLVMKPNQDFKSAQKSKRIKL